MSSLSDYANSFSQSIGLTKREREVFQSLVDKRQSHLVSYDLRVTNRTLKHYMTKIFEKANVVSRVELILKFADFIVAGIVEHDLD